VREPVIGEWPDSEDLEVVVQLARAVGDAPAWAALAAMPPVAQKLHELARLQPLDREILKHLHHLQTVCHRPRLHLRVEEERELVSRARRVPVRATAVLVSHPEDWERRTLRSIQPARVLARLVEDEWDLYENRVATRLVDELLGYLGRRLAKLRKIQRSHEEGRNYGDQLHRTSFRRANRLSALWGSTFRGETGQELEQTLRQLEVAQRTIQGLMDTRLYRNVPGRRTVGLTLRPTNILVNDPHYRKVATLWEAWVKDGHQREETQREREERQRQEEAAWGRFALHLVVRALHDLGWSGAEAAHGWTAARDGRSLAIDVGEDGAVQLRSGDRTLRLRPLCASLARADPAAVARALEDRAGPDGELVVVHVGDAAPLPDLDRSGGWSFGRRPVLLACSPYRIDSQERMSRLLNGWLSRAVPPYPFARNLPALEGLPESWAWLRRRGASVQALRAPTASEAGAAQRWAADLVRGLEAKERQAKAARQPVSPAPRQALESFRRFVEEATAALSALEPCPVCTKAGRPTPRPGRRDDGADATWWATCPTCRSEWGLRRCTGCDHRYQVLVPHTGVDLAQVAVSTPPQDWPDQVFGRDLWAQPCGTGDPSQFRCPECGECARSGCAVCGRRGTFFDAGSRSG